jgi:UDP-N-acetylmuramate dehydrogenase
MQHNIMDVFMKYGVTHIKNNQPLSRHTTWKVGGPADYFIEPTNKEELTNAMKVIHQYHLPWRVIGRGSNLLVKDGGIRGVVFQLKDTFDYLRIDDTMATAGAAYSTILLAGRTAKAGLTGLEFAGGIPGNVGGAVYMNAGAHGSEICEVLHRAEVLTEAGEWLHLSNEELKFRYRTSILQNEIRGIVTEATFQLGVGDATQITKALTSFKDRRRKTQPLQYPCAGSVFRNPLGDHAGRLVEAAGLKGYRIGDAEISTLHGNFIINLGQAKASDVLALIQHTQHIVAEKFQVTLVPEVEVIGEENI